MNRADAAAILMRRGRHAASVRPRLALALVGLALVAGIASWFLLFANTGCAAITIERAGNAPSSPTPEPAPVVLNETLVRSRSPHLAGLLDEAAKEGRATESREAQARVAHEELRREADGAPRVSWRGEVFATRMLVC